MAMRDFGKGESGLTEFAAAAQGCFDSTLPRMRSIAHFLCMPQARNQRRVSGIETNFTDH
jgi:hypothetical protein